MSTDAAPINTTYGVKTVRSLKNSKLELMPSKTDLHRQYKIDKTFDYFARVVDPIIGECVTYLILEQPENVKVAMKCFLNDKKNNIVTQRTNFIKSKTSKSQKLFLATKVSPVLTRIVTKLTKARPVDVITYICDLLAVMIEEDKQTPQVKNIQLVTLGAANVGKTSLINVLQGQYNAKVKPTLGFRPISLMLGDAVKLKLYDLGGGVKIRGIWPEYFHDVHGVIYVIDSTLSGSELNESIALFQETFTNPLLHQKPVLIYANKCDSPDRKSLTELKSLYNVYNTPGLQFKEMYEVSCLTSVPSLNEPESDLQGQAKAGAGAVPDSRIDAGVEELLNDIQYRFDTLDKRVLLDTKKKEDKDIQARIEKERKVLKNKIACAFPLDVNKESVNITLPHQPEDTFDEEAGLQFLASEVGLAHETDLPTIACNIAAKVGYQKLALQMIGALHAPISKKKQSMSWEDINILIDSLRSELGL
jgi:small GTP-binding protein